MSEEIVLDVYIKNIVNIIGDISKWVKSICSQNNLEMPLIINDMYEDYIGELTITIKIEGENFNNFIIKQNALNVVIESVYTTFDDYFGKDFYKYKNEEEPIITNGNIVLYSTITYKPDRNNENLNNNKITKDDLNNIYTSNISWDMEEVDRSFDNDKILNYLNSIEDEKIKYITKIIINNTKYIKFNELKETLIKQIELLPENINLYFGFEYNKIGSEHWLMILLWPYLKNKVYKIINTYKDIDNIYPIVLVDDAMYSGQQMLRTVDTLQDHYNEYNEDYDSIYNSDIKKNITINKILNSQFILLVGYVSDTSIVKIQNYINQSNVNIRIYSENITNNIFKYLGEYKRSKEDYLEIGYYMRENFNIMDINVPIYLDHKIAGIHSSFPDIYTKIVKELPSRCKIEELKLILNELGYKSNNKY